MEFTGERVVEGSTPRRIWLDHVARYGFASKYVKGNFVLDIACGTGYGSDLLCRRGAKSVIGMDILSETIDFARAKYKSNGLQFKVGDILEIGLSKNYFDVITCFETIEHVSNQEKALREIRRVLKPNGLLIISSPNRKLSSPGRGLNDPPVNAFHIKEHSTEEFISFLSNFFEISEVYGQRGKWKILFLPFLERAIRKFLPVAYYPGKGRPDLEKVSPLKEYRYITLVSRKTE